VLFQAKRADLVVLKKELIEAGKLTPVIDRTFPLNAAPEAIRYVGERFTQGKPSSPCEGRQATALITNPGGYRFQSANFAQTDGKEVEHGEGPHRARSLARRVYQWAERRR
jgi:hypothetical protein